MTSIISTAVLRAAVLSAFDLGRYSVTFATTPAGDDLAVVPFAIILNLEEQDDDLLGSANDLWPELFTDAEERELRREVREAFGADDHGPAVPAQSGECMGTKWEIQTGPSDQPGFSTMEEVVKVYEFALQGADCRFTTPKTLDEVQVGHAPDMNAFHAADWVHVYDRVTRERRTLKRPGAEKIIKGMSELVAGLRDRPVAMAARAQGKSAALSDAVEAALGDDLAMRRAAVEAGYASLEDHVAAPAPVTPPAPGPLTSADGLRPGDVLRFICRSAGCDETHIVTFCCLKPYDGQEMISFHDCCEKGLAPQADFAFVGRPDADGWMDWPGGENPVGDAMVEVMHTEANWTSRGRASTWNKAWRHDTQGERDIVRFRLVDLPALPSET